MPVRRINRVDGDGKPQSFLVGSCSGENPRRNDMNPSPFEIDHVFCSQPHCCLHVSRFSPNVKGQGNWATLPNGLVVGRSVQNGRYVCDLCLQAMTRARAA